jgi:1-acyl-sn-glycerol-3-phosphate acyltransferase
LKAVRRIARIGGFVGITSAMLPTFVARHALASARDRDRVRDAWVGAWSGSLLKLFAVGVDAAATTTEPSSPSHAPKGRLIVANHRSAIDIAVLLRTFGGHMVSRADLSGWPLVGAAARSVGTIFVDRASTASGVGAIREIRQKLEAGQTVILFPEGTTFEGDEVRPFHAGAFIAVLRTDAEIVPVGIAYPAGSETAFVNETFTRHLGRMAGADPTRATLRIGKPILAGPGARAADLAATARTAVQELVHAARKATTREAPGR